MAGKQQQKQQLVTVSPEWHNRLTKIAGDRTTARGKRVTLREVVEEALQLAYGRPDLTLNESLSLFEANDYDDVLFSRLFDAAIMTPDNDAIEVLGNATIEGTHGQRLELKKLAYYMRETQAAVGTMEELVKAYEGGL